MNDTDDENRMRDREIAQNESARQATSAIRVSGWAIATAVAVGLAAVGWVLLHK